jgi:hypothetical protein
MDQLAGIDVLNSPTASTEEKLAAIDEMNEAGYTWLYEPETNTYGAVDLESKPALLARD